MFISPDGSNGVFRSKYTRLREVFNDRTRHYRIVFWDIAENEIKQITELVDTNAPSGFSQSIEWSDDSRLLRFTGQCADRGWFEMVYSVEFDRLYRNK